MPLSSTQVPVHRSNRPFERPPGVVPIVTPTQKYLPVCHFGEAPETGAHGTPEYADITAELPQHKAKRGNLPLITRLGP